MNVDEIKGMIKKRIASARELQGYEKTSLVEAATRHVRGKDPEQRDTKEAVLGIEAYRNRIEAYEIILGDIAEAEAKSDLTQDPVNEIVPNGQAPVGLL